MTPVYGQICNGNLGENIFEEGDFGEGTFNIVNTDPSIAPGYTYSIAPPPNDGFYTITNNTTFWGSFAQNNWDDIQDNSSDRYGYMMVVNASYDPGLFYEKLVDGLCANTEYVFSADIYNLADGIRPNVSFLLDGEEQYNTGNIPFNHRWITYGFTFTTAPGQTSITLALRNNAPGGIGNDLALDNISFQACGPEALILPEQIANICEDGEPITLEATILENDYDTTYIQWQISLDEGDTWTNIPGATGTSVDHTILSGGYYHYRYLLSNDPNNLQNTKCRVVSNVKVVYVVPKFYTINDTICEGLSYQVGPSSYNLPGTYVDSLKTVLGCDSIVTLNLVIAPEPGIEAEIEGNDPVCYNEGSGSIIVRSIFNGNPPYTILADGSEIPLGDVYNNLFAGAYPYLITDRFGCRLQRDVVLNNPDSLYIELGPNVEIELGDTLLPEFFSGMEIGTYRWEMNDSVWCEGECQDWAFLPIKSGWVKLDVSFINGCTAYDSVFVHLIPNREIYAPTAFTPNGDGVNDFFNLFGKMPKVELISRISVFNRWGRKIFEKESVQPNSLSDGWDGSINGSGVAPEGVYVVLAAVRYLDGKTIPYAYTVTLLK